MKTLNFLPFYRSLLSSKKKTTTFRIPGETNFFMPGERIQLTIGWPPGPLEALNVARVARVYEKRINELTDEDFAGESPDCQTQAATVLVLSAIYRTVLSPETVIRVVKFSYDNSHS
jgi:hypothetical protein